MCFYRQDKWGYNVPKRRYNGKVAYKWYYVDESSPGDIYSPFRWHKTHIGGRMQAEGHSGNETYVIAGGFFHAYLSKSSAFKAAFQGGGARLFKVKMYGEGYQNSKYDEIVAKEMEVIEEVEL